MVIVRCAWKFGAAIVERSRAAEDATTPPSPPDLKPAPTSSSRYLPQIAKLLSVASALSNTWCRNCSDAFCHVENSLPDLDKTLAPSLLERTTRAIASKRTLLVLRGASTARPASGNGITVRRAVSASVMCTHTTPTMLQIGSTLELHSDCSIAGSARCFYHLAKLECSFDLFSVEKINWQMKLVVQVMLYNHCVENGFIGPGKQETCVEIDVEMFAVTTRGFDILVEYSGSLGFYVDIMVKSIRHPLKTMGFVHEHVVKPITSFCASREGCMGVDLEEHVLSQECVKHLTIRRHRRAQSVRTVDLISEVKKAQAQGDSYIHTWPKVAEGGINIQEYATVINGHVILGSETDMTRASSPHVHQALDDCYPDVSVKSGKKRGVAVLISMEGYKEGRYRWGGPVDRGRLEALVDSLKLDYDGNNFLDFDADCVRKELIHLAQTRIQPDHECFVCFINAHGGTGTDGAFFVTDCKGKQISLWKDVVEPFGKCRNLVGKPKIFFVNACRGGHELQSLDDPGAGEEQPMSSSWSEGAERRYVEQEADCLIVFSTSQYAASPRDREFGTNFAYALFRAVNKYRDSRDLKSILTLLTYNVVYMEHVKVDKASGQERILRQCPVYMSSLRKLVYWRSG